MKYSLILSLSIVFSACSSVPLENSPASQAFTDQLFAHGMMLRLDEKRAALGPINKRVSDCSNRVMSCVDVGTFRIAIPRLCASIAPGSKLGETSKSTMIISRRGAFEGELLAYQFDNSDKFLISSSDLPDVFFDYSVQRGLIGAFRARAGSDLLAMARTGHIEQMSRSPGGAAEYVVIDSRGFGRCNI